MRGLQGVPVRVEVGPRDVQQGACVMARRDRPGKDGKTFGVPMEPAAFVDAVQVHCRAAGAAVKVRLAPQAPPRSTAD